MQFYWISSLFSLQTNNETVIVTIFKVINMSNVKYGGNWPKKTVLWTAHSSEKFNKLTNELENGSKQLQR